MNVLTSNATLPVVLSYIRKGWRVVPIPRGSKAPKINRWQLLQITEAEAPRYFDHACNIGVILDNGLVDGDLDCSEAIDLAPEILPPTTAIFGRRSKPESHWLYRVKGTAPAEKFTDPLTGEMLVELRGNGGLQTIFPGSIHPSGELVEWFNDEAFDDELPTPTEVEADTLRKAFRKLAACSLIRRYYKNAEDVIDDQCVEQAIRELDPRVGERVRIWLGMQPSANLSLSSQPMNGLRELPEYLKYETHHGPTVSERLEDSLRTAWSPAEQSRLQTALTAIDVKSCGYEDFLKIGFALHDLKWDRADGTSIGFELWDAWCSLSEHYNQAGLGSKWQSFERSARSGVTTGTVFHMAKERGWSPPENPNSSLATRPEAAVQGQAQETPHPDQGVSLNDFYAYMPKHAYIFVPSRDLWPPSSVDSRLGAIPLFNRDAPKLDQKSGKQQTITAHLWLDQNRHVEQMTWAPGLPLLIPNRLISEGGWLEHEGAACFNLYRPPNIELGNAAEAHRWLNHVRKVYDESAGHIVQWLAHRVQHPSVKINHALVLGGNQGIGKDTLLEPAKYAVARGISPRCPRSSYSGGSMDS